MTEKKYIYLDTGLENVKFEVVTYQAREEEH